jgi:hypothetical protein
MRKLIIQRGLLFVATAVVVMGLAAPPLRAQFDECCRKYPRLQWNQCQGPGGCIEEFSWRPCTAVPPGIQGWPGYRFTYWCCDWVPFDIWRLDDRNTCYKTLVAEGMPLIASHIRPFYVRGCDGDYVLVSLAEKV